MKVALTYPYCWPEVRRGGERLFHDVAEYLLSAGVDVTSVTAQGGAGGRVLQPGPVRLRRAVPDVKLPRRVVVDRPVSYLPGTAMALGRIRPDLVHGMFHLDGVAARMARPLTGRVPYLVHVQGMPQRENLDRLKAHRALFGPSVRAAAAVLAVSRAAARALEEDFGVEARAFHNGVFTHAYGTSRLEDRSAGPTVFFPADPSDRRKRVELLAEAMTRLESRWQTARLAVAGEPPPDVAARLKRRLGDRVHFLGILDESAMIRAYARTWITCLPAVREAFGLVIVESLASGRPCVAIRDGGVPEILGTGQGASWLSEVDDVDSLASAICTALSDSEGTATVEVCRQMAQPFDWSVRGPDLVQMYRELSRR